MNNFILKIKQNLKRRKYKKYIEEHKENVEKAFYEMIMCPNTSWMNWEFYHADLYERCLIHDDSKYSKEEFEPYRKNFYPVNQKEKEKNKEAFDKAWEHHWKTNRHHWEARQNDEDTEGLTREQILDCLENVLDWMAMGYKFNDRPYQYYEKIKDKIILPKAQKEFIEKIIYEGIDKKYIKGE